MCEHKTVCVLSLRSNYEDTDITYDGPGISNPMDLLMGSDVEDPEEVEFPSEIVGLGIKNRSSSSTVQVSMKICVDCKTIL